MIEQPPKILIVEDDPDQRMLISEALGMHYDSDDGDAIVGVGTAGECLGLDLSQFDAILLDYNLPDMSGLVLLGKILACADVPVVFVTGENTSAVAVEAIQNGAQDYVVKLGDYLFALPLIVEKNIRLHGIKKENERLQQRHEEMLAELKRKNQQLAESLDRLREMADTDPLTGVSNRRRFAEILESYYSEGVRYGFDLTCCMCDLDHYKQLNDTLGHQVGDQVLIVTADVIRSSLRTSDAAARYGGDEFVLLLPHTSMKRGLAVGERIREELRQRGLDDPKIGRALSLSVGVASLNANHPTSADALVAMADRALYVAKDRGKDRIIAFGEVNEKAPVIP